MLPNLSNCLLCQARGLTSAAPRNAATLSRVTPITLHSRFASTRTRRKPSRMTLSEHVERPRRYGEAKAPPRRMPNSPFGGMNQTVPPTMTRMRNRNSVSRAQLQRSTPKGVRTPEPKKETALFRALKMQAMLTPVHYEKRNRIKSSIETVTSFKSFRLLPSIQEAIEKTLFAEFDSITPTPIQRLAIPALLDEAPHKLAKKPRNEEGEEIEDYNFKQFLLAAETGSGKSLAYILPVVDAIKREEEAERIAEAQLAKQKAEEEEKRAHEKAFELDTPKPDEPKSARPRAIILVPTAELVVQIGRVVKLLSHKVKYRSIQLSSTFSPRRISNSLFQPQGVDIIVTTPHLLSSITRTHPLVLSKVSHIVVDEADSLLDRSFAPITNSIIDRAASSLKRLIFASATIPKSLDNTLIKRFPGVKRLVTPNLHAVPRRIQLGVVDVQKDPYMGNKKLACADIIWTIGKAGAPSDLDPIRSAAGLPVPKHLIVFVNERATVDEIVEFLRTKGIAAVGLTRDTSEQRQSEILDEFTFAKPPATERDVRLAQRIKKNNRGDDMPFVKDGPQETNKLPDTKVLVTTDLGSRGIDTVAVRTVILYDVPHTTVDFIHRLGRAGRMNRRGRGIVLVDKKDRKDIVREVKEAMHRGQALV